MAFYVSAIKGRRHKLLVGPFRHHGDALAHEAEVRTWAARRFTDARFPDVGIGTARHRTAHAPGALNDDYGITLDDSGWCGRLSTQTTTPTKDTNQ